MKGLIMDYQLTIPKILERARRVFPDKELVSKIGDTKHRTTYGEFYGRVVRLMNVLRGLGVKKGDRVATYAWNHKRHLELYYAIPCLGAVLHTLNIRLFPTDLTYVINHAQDSVIFVDDSLLAQLEPLKEELKTVRHFVVMSEHGALPDSPLAPLHEYEALMAATDEREEFPDLEETDASGLCYTSGTTGNPKGVLYTHRGTYLVGMMAGMKDSLDFSEAEVMLPVVPMFHANCWNVPYTCAMVGAKQVYAGSNVAPEHLVQLIHEEQVTYGMGVPTIWNGMLQYLRETGQRIDSVTQLLSGGSSVPRVLIQAYQEEYGIHIRQAWGMTEMSPIGSITTLTRKMRDWPPERQLDVRAKVGIPPVAVELKIVDEDGAEVPWDGQTTGELQVRGPAVASAYYKNDEATAQAVTADGWFRTGDVAFIDENSVLQIADRTKDVIKSGGEWISSVEMENAIMACPGVLESAVVARPDPKWDERPVAFVVRRADTEQVEALAVLDFLQDKFAKWQLPSLEDIRFIKEIPRTAVGKFDKKVLRTQL